MYVEETACFDPTSMPEPENDGLCQHPPPAAPPPPLPPYMAEDDVETQFHHHHHHNHHQQLFSNTNLIMQDASSYQHNNINNINNNNNNNNNLISSFTNVQEIQDLSFNPTALTEPQPYPPPTPDLLNLLHLPRCSSDPTNSSITFTTNPHQDASFYDPLFHLNLPPQPLLRGLNLMKPLPPYTLPASSTGSLFGVEDENNLLEGNEGGGGGGVYQDGDGAQQFDYGVLEFSRDMAACVRKARQGGSSTKHFATERQRRQQFNDKYDALKSLVPNPTKSDRASVVGDAIEYIKELLRTVNELKLLVEKKRWGRERSKRPKTEEDAVAATGDVESSNIKPANIGDPDYNGSLRSSWLQRKSKDMEVDVRIIDDEVTIKLVQRKKNNCLLFVSKVLDELQLDLHHVAGGHVGEYSSFLFNTKIYEGSSVYASAIANKLIEVVDRQYASPPTSCFQ